MTKNNKWIFIGLAAVILLAVLFLPTKTKEKDFLEVRFYDANGNIVATSESFSSLQTTVTPPGISGISAIDFVIRAHNLPSSTVFLDFTLKTLTQSNGGTEFNNALTKTRITNIAPDGYAIWTSDKITIPSSWVGVGAITFTTTVGAQFGTTTLTDKSGSIILTFSSDPTGAFEVSVGSGTYATNVQFRTGNLNYPGTSVLTDAWIAYSDADVAPFACGNNLVGYGFNTVIKQATGSCGNLGLALMSGAQLPHTPTIHLTLDTGVGLWYLFKSSVGFLQVCEPENDGIGYGYIQYGLVNYPSTTPAATDTQGVSVDSSREVIC